MTLTDQLIKNIIRKLIKGKDYRIEIVTLINAEFLQYAIDFFKKVVDAKLKNENITVDWYKKEFLNPNLSSSEIAINSGLNKKTITNMYNTARREIVIEASNEHYDILYNAIKELTEAEHELDLKLTIKLRGVSVDLNVSESLIVINTLAVKRAELRGGLWSTAGKRVEKYLMITICKVFDVPIVHYDQSRVPDSIREVDFYLINDNNFYRCEVKLMGKGNPESADAIFARESSVFIADKLSDLNKQQATNLNCEWVELRSIEGYKRFSQILSKLRIPHTEFNGDIDRKLNIIFGELFK
ncbi:MAG: CfrBI family restriction endonuclease [Ignavibacterium sp.]|nr:CfrBI family restriction endonuclease [Ignavibacterium sp.]